MATTPAAAAAAALFLPAAAAAAAAAADPPAPTPPVSSRVFLHCVDTPVPDSTPAKDRAAATAVADTTGLTMVLISNKICDQQTNMGFVER